MLLREGLLEGVKVVLACPEHCSKGSFAASTASLCERLGAEVAAVESSFAGTPEEREALTEAAVADALRQLGGASVLIVDAAATYERSPGPAGLTDALQLAWEVTRALAAGAFIPEAAGGRIFLLAPRSGDGNVHAAGAAAGLENLARTLSVEWARYGITTVALAPGAQTSTTEVATLCGWLASPAGDYFSGCLLDLRGPRA